MPLLKSEALEELKQYKSYQKNPSPSFPENILHFVCGLVSKLIPNVRKLTKMQKISHFLSRISLQMSSH